MVEKVYTLKQLSLSGTILGVGYGFLGAISFNDPYWCSTSDAILRGIILFISIILIVILSMYAISDDNNSNLITSEET